MAASFKGVEQIKNALNNGAQAITPQVGILKQRYSKIQTLKKQRMISMLTGSMHGEGKGICDL